jgi:bacillolysin
MKKTTLTFALALLFVLTANNIFAQTTFVPKAVQSNNTVIQGLCDKVESNGWLYFKDETEIDPYTFFEDYASDMGLGTNDEMVVEKTWDSEDYTHIKFKLFHKSIPVKGGVYTMHLRDCHVELAHGKIVEELDITLPATLSESTALQNALNAIGATVYAWQDSTWENDLKEEEEDSNATYFPVGELEIYGESDVPKIASNFKLAYKFDIVSLQPYEFQEVYIDAHTGQVIKKSDNGLYSDGTCVTLFNGSRAIKTDHRWLQNDYILRDNSRGKYIWTKYWDSNNNPWGLMNNVTDDNNSWGTPDSDATSAHWAAEMAWDYFLDTWDRDGPDGGGKKLRILADWNLHGQAKWENYSGQNAIWIGGDSTTQSGIGTLDIVSHEYTHGVAKSAAGLVGGGTDEQSALVESFADIFGEVVEHYVLGVHDWVQAGETGGTIPKRNLLNPNATSNPDKYITGTFWDSNGDPHINCGVQNRWFSLLSDGGYLNGVQLYNGIGFDKATKIAYISLNGYLQEGATYLDAREAAINAAKSLYGACSIEVQLTTNAWAAVGVGPIYNSSCLLNIHGPISVCTDHPYDSWTVDIPPGQSITWYYPSWWNCTISGVGNRKLTLISFSSLPPPPVNTSVVITANSSSGASDTHNVLVSDCLNSPPCGVSERSSSTNKTYSSRDNFDKNEIKIFPNPVSEKLRITNNLTEETYRIEIVSMLGIVGSCRV